MKLVNTINSHRVVKGDNFGTLYNTILKSVNWLLQVNIIAL